MKTKFWGTRGSISAPSCKELSTIKYGGNTPCVEIIASDGTIVVIDMGTGMRVLGNELMGISPEGEKEKDTSFNTGKGEVSVLLSHFHWDHIQGMPFFKPLYVKGNKVDFYAGEGCEKNLKYQMKKPFFPVELNDTMSSKNYFEFKDGDIINIGCLKVEVRKLDHTDDVYGFRIEDGSKVVTYASDVEHDLNNKGNLMRLARDSDILIYDCQYTYMEYDPESHGQKGMGKRQWGHSIIQEGIKISAEAGVKKLVSFHHSPESGDVKIDDVIKFAEEYKKDFDSKLKIIAAHEGLEIDI